MKKYIFIINLLCSLESYSSSNKVIWSEIGEPLDMTGQNLGDRAGFSVAMNPSGTIVAIGEPNWSGSENLFNGNGRVQVYNLVNGFWTAMGGPLDMTGQNLDDKAGWSVAISSDGTTIAMGEIGWNSNYGRVRAYNLVSGAWVATGGDQDMAGENSGDQAGTSVAISSDGKTVVVGEPGWSNGFGTGRVLVYNLVSGSWVATGGTGDMIGLHSDDNAGTSVAISSDGRTVAIGAPGFSENDSRGRVQVFNLIPNVSGSSWIQTGGAIDMIGQNLRDQAGTSVAISSDGTIVAVGEPGWSGSTEESFFNGRGRVQVYNLVNGSWTALGGAFDMTGQNLGDQAGYSVAMNPSGTTVAIGELGWPGGIGTGRVRAYNLINGSWVVTGTALVMVGQSSDNGAGASVAISSDGATIAMGEPGWTGISSNRGRVRVFQLQNVVVYTNYQEASNVPLLISVPTQVASTYEDMYSYRVINSSNY